MHMHQECSFGLPQSPWSVDRRPLSDRTDNDEFQDESKGMIAARKSDHVGIQVEVGGPIESAPPKLRWPSNGSFHRLTIELRLDHGKGTITPVQICYAFYVSLEFSDSV